VSKELFNTVLYLPAQAAAETEATLTKWHVAPGDTFKKGQILAEAESAKSSFEFEAPCDGTVVKLLFADGASAPIDAPVIEISTSDTSIKKEIPSAAAAAEVEMPKMDVNIIEKQAEPELRQISLLGIGAYLPDRIVTNKELLVEHPDITEEYIMV
jgi:pyruvate/2-oxoglutarate dehydrogenase complex dihydrolipoamide acyltransferase (E2) component